jgi:hypothetical protein
MDSNKNDSMAEEKTRILKYLEEQLLLKVDALHAMEEPITTDTIKDVRKMEELILKREIYDLRRHIQVIKMM